MGRSVVLFYVYSGIFYDCPIDASALARHSACQVSSVYQSQLIILIAPSRTNRLAHDAQMQFQTDKPNR